VGHGHVREANLEMHGTPGNFFDPRLDNADKYPVAAKAKMGHVQSAPERDRISPRLAALQFGRLAIPAPKAPDGMFDVSAASRGRDVFEDQSKCAACHVPPTFTEPGWNLHSAQEMGIDDFQASRSPDDRYRTMPLAGRAVLAHPRVLPRRPFWQPHRRRQLLQRRHPGANNGAPLGFKRSAESRPDRVPSVDLT
jgi:hypothetical protein